MFGVLSGLSAYSLLALGGVSLILSGVYFSPSGLFISFAMLGHGWYEKSKRSEFLDTPSFETGRRLALNQLALAASLSVYAFWQMARISDEEVKAILFRESVKPAFQMLDPRMQIELMNMLPTYVRAVYWGVFGLAWIGCGTTALYYLRTAKTKVGQLTSDRVSE